MRGDRGRGEVKRRGEWSWEKGPQKRIGEGRGGEGSLRGMGRREVEGEE